MIVLQHTFASQPTGAARVLAMLPVSQLEDPVSIGLIHVPSVSQCISITV